MESITIRLDAFEGPMDLLCHLIEKNKINIYDIPIASLTEQYIDFISNAQNKDMDNMSQFIVMASTLLEIKSKMLLPIYKTEETEEEDPRSELVKKLIEYKKFKACAIELEKRQEKASLVFFKEPDISIKDFKIKEDKTLSEFLNGISIDNLFNAFQEVMNRKESRIDTVRSGFKSIDRDLFTIKDRTEYIKDLLVLNPKINFNSIFRSDSRKIEVVVTFLALLELIKTKTVCIYQEGIFKEITITSNHISN